MRSVNWQKKRKRRNMKLLIINPNSDKRTNQRIEEKVQRLAEKEDRIDVENLENTPKLINTGEDVLKASVELESRILAKQEKYDGFIIACHSDPGLETIRKKSAKPILGIGEASYELARLWGKKMGIIVPSESSAQRKKEAVKKYNCAELLTGIKVSDGDDWNSLLRAARCLQTDYDIESIILGCANYCYAKERLEEESGLKVFDGVWSAVKLAEILLNKNPGN